MSGTATTFLLLLAKATALLALGLLARTALRRASAATRHLGLTLAMIGLVTLPLLVWGLPVWRLAVLPANPSPSAPVVSAGDWPSDPPGASVRAGSPTAGFRQLAPVTPATTAGWPVLDATRWLLLVWAAGAGLVLLRLAAGLHRVRSIVRVGARVDDPAVLRLLDDCASAVGLRRSPRLIASERAGVPLVWGCLRPALVVPRAFLGWSPERIRAVLLHELGHLRRHDWVVLLLGRLTAAAYWFHPLVWVVERYARLDCERACDDIVVTCGTRPSEYASHLLSIARGFAEPPASARAALAVVRRSQLNDRLRSILDPMLRRGAPSRPAATTLATVALVLLVPLASVQLSGRVYADEPHEMHDKIKQHAAGVHEREAERGPGQRAYETGYALHGQGRYDEAIGAFQEALDLGYRAGAATYNIACCLALQGDAAGAMRWLDRAVEAGFDDPTNLVRDTDFDRIRRDTSFQSYVDRAFERAGIEREYPEHYPRRATLEHFARLKDDRSTDGKDWSKTGYRLIGLGEYASAAEAFRTAIEHLGQDNAAAMYNLGCALALQGSSREALGWLDRSVDAGLDQHERFLNDRDLDGVRGSAEFERIKNKSEFLSLGRFPRRSWEESDYSAERWAPAVTEYQDWVARNPTSGRGWFDLGYALHYSGRHDEAANAFAKAATLGFRPATSTYNVACANAMAGHTQAALDALESAVTSGHFGSGQLRHDTDLDGLREEPRFKQLIERLEQEQDAEPMLQRKIKQGIEKALQRTGTV